jgi:hypothetical protein
VQNSQTLAGVLLLRLAIDECSRQRFLQTFPAWGIKLLGVVKAATATEVRRSVWAALRSLFLRISHMLELPGVRQEGSALAGKLAGALGPLLKRIPGKHPLACSHIQSPMHYHGAPSNAL